MYTGTLRKTVSIKLIDTKSLFKGLTSKPIDISNSIRIEITL